MWSLLNCSILLSLVINSHCKVVQVVGNEQDGLFTKTIASQPLLSFHPNSITPVQYHAPSVYSQQPQPSFYAVAHRHGGNRITGNRHHGGGGYGGGYHQGGYQGGYHQSGYPGGHHQGRYPGGYHQGRYPGGHHQGGYPGGHHQGGYPGGHHQGGYPGGYHQGGYGQGYYPNNHHHHRPHGGPISNLVGSIAHGIAHATGQGHHHHHG